MEIICKDVSPIQDLRVKIHDSTIVFPIETTQRRSYFLSNLDQFLNYYVSILQFFQANPKFPPKTVIKRLKIALQKVLVSYDFAAGRVRLNHQSGRLEIDCNAAGAGFVVASSEFSLDEIGELVYPNPGYKQLAAQKLDNDNNNINQPICIFQVTTFKCGGFSIALSGNHMLYDGTGTRMFLENIASQAFEENRPFTIIPCFDRSLLASRSPPRVTFPHPEFLKLDPLDESKISIFSVQDEVLDSKIFTLNSNQINYLKNKAIPNNGSKLKNTTIFNVVAALIWRCKALSMDIENDNKDRVSALLYAVEIRSKLSPPLPPSYCGNAVLNTYASSHY